MRAFIDENELEVLRAEEFVRTNARALKRSSDVAIILSGRIDLVCRRSDGRLFLLDMKTGNWLPSDLEWAALPSTVIYTMLGHELRRQNQDIRERTMGAVEVAQILPHLAAYASAWLTEYDLEEGRSMLRCLVLALDAGHYPATRGEWCAYCPPTPPVIALPGPSVTRTRSRMSRKRAGATMAPALCMPLARTLHGISQDAHSMLHNLLTKER